MTFLRVYSNSKELSYLPWQKKYPNLKTTFDIWSKAKLSRGGSRTAVASKMKHYMIIVNGFQLLTIITKRSILDVAAALDPPLLILALAL